MRALRVLLACLLLALSARPTAAPAWNDAIVLVATAQPAGAPEAARVAQSAGARSLRGDRLAPVAGPVEPGVWREPAGTTRGLVLVRQRYLRNLALLC
jgi:hypothetical protein